jgi:hypothetical protein
VDDYQEYDGGPALGDQGQEWAGYDAWLDREIAAGRDPDEPGESWETQDLAPGSAARPRFGQGDEADVLPPGPLLAGLTDSAVGDLERLSADELIGVLQGARRQEAREQYKQVVVTAEFARRRQAAFEAARARGVPAAWAPGAFPGEELAAELGVTRAEAAHRIDDAQDLTSRLPRTLAGMAAGLVDLGRAGWIALYTRSLSDVDAARADEILAAVAPELRGEQVARKAAALEMKLNPEAVRARKERTRRDAQRVEARRELSGNASLSAREMATADAMACKSHIDAVALELRAGGAPGTLGALRVLALTDLAQGRNPLDRLGPQATPPAPVSADPPADPDTWPGWGSDPGDDLEDLDRDDPGEPERAAPVPTPALINLIVPAGTLLGWSSAPGEAGTWGLLDRDETRSMAGAAAQHSQTRWCVTLTAPDGTALAPGCARGQHPDLLSQLGEDEPGDAGPAPPARLAALLRRLSPIFTTIAKDGCDHACAEEHYTPSRKLRHLVRARNATCDAPGCDAPAVNADLDHTIPWPDGPTCQGNLAPRCRTHHRAKQAPDWKVEQLRPGVSRWTMPSGRTHVTRPTKYDS